MLSLGGVQCVKNICDICDNKEDRSTSVGGEIWHLPGALRSGENTQMTLSITWIWSMSMSGGISPHLGHEWIRIQRGCCLCCRLLSSAPLWQCGICWYQSRWEIGMWLRTGVLPSAVQCDITPSLCTGGVQASLIFKSYFLHRRRSSLQTSVITK